MRESARQRRLRWLATALWCALWGGLTLPVLAKPYLAPMDESSWTVDSSIFECRMSHEIPHYGAAVFEQRAGEAARFQLRPQSPRLQAGEAALVSSAPVWRPGGARRSLGTVSVTQGRQPVTLRAGPMEQMLAELLMGQDLVFSHVPWYGEERSLQVMLSPISFRPAYQQYLQCLARLLPVNFEQIRRTAIYFPVGGDQLPASELQKLDNIAVYVKADASVQAFYIDGHTDSEGNRSDNLELSQRRADAVVELLRDRGISADMIVSRWHGERYPVATNRSAEGRAQNRRVTIRLEKSPPVPVELPPLARADTDEEREAGGAESD